MMFCDSQRELRQNRDEFRAVQQISLSDDTPRLVHVGQPRREKMIEGIDDRIWYKPPFDFNSEEDKNFRNQSYSLTEQGQQAADAIVKAVAVQLSEE